VVRAPYQLAELVHMPACAIDLSEINVETIIAKEEARLIQELGCLSVKPSIIDLWTQVRGFVPLLQIKWKK